MVAPAGLQEAFDNANSEDDLLVAPGTLTASPENDSNNVLFFENKPISVECSDRSGSACIIDGQSVRSALRIFDTLGKLTTLSYFTLQNGDPLTTASGGGIYLYQAIVRLVVVTLKDNAVSDSGDGGGIGTYQTNTLTMVGCKFSGNTATGTGNDGPDIYWDYGTATVSGCPVGYAQTQESALEISNKFGGTITSPAYSFACAICDAGKSSTAGAASCSITCPSGHFASRFLHVLSRGEKFFRERGNVDRVVHTLYRWEI
ncbi:hypothetical protein ScalyP_jg4340 [Parmales sp. scaly parma]|nr:hypothetical protein ScalyP_jg4340 [Parmales sp. scaly parma]